MTNLILTWMMELRMFLCLIGLGTAAATLLIRPKRESWILAGLLLLGFAVFTRGGSTKIHAHDVFHYQMGSRYAEEMGYTGIYAATAVALRELENEKKIPENRAPRKIRDLRKKSALEVVVGPELATETKARYSPERWERLKRDLGAWENEYALEWDRIVHDAGFNPSPWWTVMGKGVNLIFPNVTSLRWVWVIDAALMAAAFLIMIRTFGWRATGYAAVFFLLFPPGRFAAFDYTAPSILRMTWLFALTAGLCAFKTQRYFVAGALLAAASAERIFPGAWAAAAGFTCLAMVPPDWRKKEAWTPLVSLAAGGLITAAGILLAILVVVGGTSFREFVSYIPDHTSLLFTNHFGWARATGFHPHMNEVTFMRENMRIFHDWSNILTARNMWPSHIAMRLALLIGAGWWAWRQKNAFGTAWLGAAIIFLGTTPAHYYLVGLLPLMAITIARDEKLKLQIGACAFALAAAGTLGVQLGETIGWALVSMLMLFALAMLAASTLPLKNKETGRWLAACLCVLLLAAPQMQITRGKQFRANLVGGEGRIPRYYLEKNSKEIRDIGRVIHPDQAIAITTKTEKDHSLKIRTDSCFAGTLRLEGGDGKEIRKWTVEPRGSLFTTLEAKLPAGKYYKITWEGPGKDIGIFSVWTEETR